MSKRRWEFEMRDEIEIFCPECGEPLSWRDEVFLLVESDTVLGCSQCLKRYNAQEWYGERPGYEYWEE